MSLKGVFLLLAVLVVTSLQGDNEHMPEYVVSECYGNLFNFDCGHGKKIRINRDIFGVSRPDKDGDAGASCRRRGNGDCVVSNPKRSSLIRRYCNGRRWCANYQAERRACNGYYTNYEQVEYNCVPDDYVTDICKATRYTTNGDAYIASPNFPATYRPNLSCACLIMAPSTDQDVKLEVVHMAIEYAQPCGDWLQIGSRRMCGTAMDFYVGSAIPVLFHSDSSGGHRGFWLHITAGRPGSTLFVRCGTVAEHLQNGVRLRRQRVELRPPRGTQRYNTRERNGAHQPTIAMSRTRKMRNTDSQSHLKETVYTSSHDDVRPDRQSTETRSYPIYQYVSGQWEVQKSYVNGLVNDRSKWAPPKKHMGRIKAQFEVNVNEGLRTSSRTSKHHRRYTKARRGRHNELLGEWKRRSDVSQRYIQPKTHTDKHMQLEINAQLRKVTRQFRDNEESIENLHVETYAPIKHNILRSLFLEEPSIVISATNEIPYDVTGTTPNIGVVRRTPFITPVVMPVRLQVQPITNPVQQNDPQQQTEQVLAVHLSQPTSGHVGTQVNKITSQRMFDRTVSPRTTVRRNAIPSTTAFPRTTSNVFRNNELFANSLKSTATFANSETTTLSVADSLINDKVPIGTNQVIHNWSSMLHQNHAHPHEDQNSPSGITADHYVSQSLELDQQITPEVQIKHVDQTKPTIKQNTFIGATTTTTKHMIPKYTTERITNITNHAQVQVHTNQNERVNWSENHHHKKKITSIVPTQTTTTTTTPPLQHEHLHSASGQNKANNTSRPEKTTMSSTRYHHEASPSPDTKAFNTTGRLQRVFVQTTTSSSRTNSYSSPLIRRYQTVVSKYENLDNLKTSVSKLLEYERTTPFIYGTTLSTNGDNGHIVVTTESRLNFDDVHKEYTTQPLHWMTTDRNTNNASPQHDANNHHDWSGTHTESRQKDQSHADQNQLSDASFSDKVYTKLTPVKTNYVPTSTESTYPPYSGEDTANLEHHVDDHGIRDRRNNSITPTLAQQHLTNVIKDTSTTTIDISKHNWDTAHRITTRRTDVIESRNSHVKKTHNIYSHTTHSSNVVNDWETQQISTQNSLTFQHSVKNESIRDIHGWLPASDADDFSVIRIDTEMSTELMPTAETPLHPRTETTGVSLGLLIPCVIVSTGIVIAIIIFVIVVYNRLRERIRHIPYTNPVISGARDRLRRTRFGQKLLTDAEARAGKRQFRTAGSDAMTASTSRLTGHFPSSNPEQIMPVADDMVQNSLLSATRANTDASGLRAHTAALLKCALDKSELPGAPPAASPSRVAGLENNKIVAEVLSGSRAGSITLSQRAFPALLSAAGSMQRSAGNSTAAESSVIPSRDRTIAPLQGLSEVTAVVENIHHECSISFDSDESEWETRSTVSV